MKKEIRIKIMQEREKAKNLRKLYNSNYDQMILIKKEHEKVDKKVKFLENLLIMKEGK